MKSSIVQHFLRWARERGDDEAIRDRTRGLSRTFSESAEEVVAAADLLPETGGRPLALATGNRASFVELFLAARSRGVPVAAIDAGLPYGEKVSICRALGAPVLLHVDGEHGEAWRSDTRRSEFSDVDGVPLPASTALIKLTSGSTGEPKGACFDEASLVAGIRQIGAAMELAADDRILLAIPLSHSYGFDNGVLSLAVLGTPLVLQERFFPGSVLRGLDDGRVTFLPLAPPLVRSLGGAQWPAELPLRRVICAGGRLSPAAAEAFRRASGLRVHDFYGSTETGGICFESHPEEPGAAGTVGRPLPGVELLVDDDGRLRVRSAANLIGVVGGPRDPEPRTVRMGDLVRIEEDGRVRLLGRSAHVLNVGGRKVPASRVEEALRRCPGVLDAAVVGVEDEVRGDRAVAFVVSREWPIETKGMEAGLVPRELRRVPELPYGERGKLDRRRLRSWADSGPAGSERE